MENNIPLNTIIHMLTIKLGSFNYLSWKNQIIPILSYQNLFNHVDGTGITPPSTRREADKTVDNPDYSAWVLADQKMRPLMATLPLKGFTPSMIKFNSFKRELNLLSNMAGYSKPFVISLSLLDIRWMKVTNCSGFFAVYVLILKPSTSIRSARPAPSFAYLLSRTESHEMFYQALYRSFSPIVAFTATHQPPPSTGRGHGGSYRPLLHIPVIDDEIAKAFVSQCHVGSAAPDWYVDSGATYHMTTTTDNITNVTPASSTNFVTFGNNQSLPILHIGSSRLLNNVVLNDILVVPRLTKNLLFVSKLTRDNHVDVLLSHPNFFVQDRTTK
ncbi:hypothetical protein Tco_0122322 [Tanacetum coccineum]